MTEVRQLRRIEWTLKETERLHPVAFVIRRRVICLPPGKPIPSDHRPLTVRFRTKRFRA